MSKLYVSNKDETPRLFSNDFIEFFSKVHWTVPLIIYIPVVMYFLYISYFNFGISLLNIILLYLAGIFAWTLKEYLLHRFIFHYTPKTDFGRRMVYIFHGIHHAYPKDSLRLVMPPSVSIPLAFLFYFFYKFLLGGIAVNPFFAGVVSGYLMYDMTHYSIHHFAIKNKVFLKIKSHHMKHHYTDHNLGYGVSQPLWDFVFKTMFQN